MNNLILTTKGKLKIKQYIEICKKKKNIGIRIGYSRKNQNKITHGYLYRIKC